MSIAVKLPPRVRIRRLKELHGYLTQEDICELTGYAPSVVKVALNATGQLAQK